MNTQEFQNFDVETKEDSLQKLQQIAGLPTKHFIFGPEFNQIVAAIKYIRDNYGDGSVGNLQQVVEQGGEVVLDLGDNITFFLNLPFNNGIDRNSSIGMLAGVGSDTQIGATLSVNESSAVLSASGANGVRIYEMRRNAIAVELTEGSYNILDFIWTRPLAVEDYARVSVEMPTPKHGTTVRYLYPYSLVSGDLIMATQQWVNSQIDTAVVGLLDDRGNWNPADGLFPNIGGSGTDGAVLKGDLWLISAPGSIGGVGVTAGDVVRALVDNPGQTASNWSISENNLGYVPENSANKATTMTGNTGSNAVFLSAKAVFDWVTGLLANATTAGILKLYAAAGDNTDGTITQKFFNDTVLAKKGIENANYQILATDKWVYTLGNFSANRTFTLPGDAPQGKEVIVADEQGTIGAFTLTIAAPAGKKLNGVVNGTEVIQAPYGWRRFVTDGDGNWFFDAGIVRQAQLSNGLALKMNLENWVDYSSLSTINGFSALNTVVIKYIPIGKSFKYYFFVSGTSNGPNFTFTIHTNHLGSTYFTGGGLNRNGGNLSNNAPRITITSNSATISVLNTLAGSTWSAAGTKEASGWFIVESN